VVGATFDPVTSADDRRERLRMLATENLRRRERPRRVQELAEATGRDVSLDDVLALQAAEQLWEAVRDQAKYHSVWHRIWGERLAGEAARTLREIADEMADAPDAFALWNSPPEAVRAPVAPLLRWTADHLSEQTDLTLVSADAKSGLVLTWEHTGHADEYTLITWGTFAFDVTQQR
jgi:hypothetical protein